jgi:hypothetical protein
MQTGVSYFSSRVLPHVREDLREMIEQGCTYVVHCYTETDLAHYRETMADIAKATRDAGLEVWFDPWGLVGIFSGETFTRFPLQHPETWQVLSDGRRVGAACPNHPATRGFLREWVDACAAAGGEVLMWDEPHFYSPLWVRDFTPAWGCYCDICSTLFRDQHGTAMPKEFTPEVKLFREATLLDLLTEMCRYGHEKGMRNCLCLFPTDLTQHGFARPGERLRSAVEALRPNASPSDIEAMMHIGVGDFDQAAAIPDLDIFATDPYWYALGVEAEPFMRTYSEEAAAAAKKHNRELQLWLQAFRVPAGREEELRIGARVAEEVGATHLAAWSFQATASMSIACADPPKVWSIVGEEFRRIRGQEAK